MLHICMLGPFKVLRDGNPVPAPVWGSQQTRTIPQVPLTRRGHVVCADQLVDIFWLNDAPNTARNRLHMRSSQLRRALNPGDFAADILTEVRSVFV